MIAVFLLNLMMLSLKYFQEFVTILHSQLKTTPKKEDKNYYHLEMQDH